MAGRDGSLSFLCPCEGRDPDWAPAFAGAQRDGPDRKSAGPGASPDRADAMVWALWALCLAAKAAPQIVAW